MGECMAAADLIIARAGAITLSELAVCAKPSILIPSPYVAENHQFHNAMSLKKIGAAEVIEEKDLDTDILTTTVEKLIHNRAVLENMSQKALLAAIPNSCELIYKEVMKLYTSHKY
jgi:UDP-N-acetylglucosamine--N-acetylmuramyl-(pentapeptide) pyrophosphoryl-undecaprenol N-acetylglucosamine transferase